MSTTPAVGSRHSTPTRIEMGERSRSAAVAYASRNPSRSSMRRAAPGPRAAELLRNPSLSRNFSAVTALPIEIPVASMTELALGAAWSDRSASQTASVDGRQPTREFKGTGGLPAVSTTISVLASSAMKISAAPDSSTQPTRAFLAASRAPGDMRGATMTSGRGLMRNACSTCLGHPTGSHRTRAFFLPANANKFYKLQVRRDSAHPPNAHSVQCAARFPVRSRSAPGRPCPKYISTNINTSTDQ